MRFQSIYLIMSATLIILTFAIIPPKESPNKIESKLKKEKKIIQKTDDETTKLQISKSCRGLTICKHAPDYPRKKIQKLLKNLTNLIIPTNSNNVSLIAPPNESINLDVSARSSMVEFTNLCRTRIQTMAPKYGYDLLTQAHRFIINVKRYYVQIVKYETCVEPNEYCINAQYLPIGFRTKCIQKYNNIRLMSLSKDGLSPDYGLFQVPSTCICGRNVKAKK